MSIFKMTCKDVYPLISEEMDHPLSFGGRIRLKIHLGICHLCVIYRKQLQVLRNLAKNIGKGDSEVNENATLNPDTKEKIRKYIKEKI
ncbi:MAG: zf-HC2 domain-containing protein [Nitrospinae bacterium]|nr:zf-HC2 domain-containing protein [Nitrospinota bacterium]